MLNVTRDYLLLRHPFWWKASGACVAFPSATPSFETLVHESVHPCEPEFVVPSSDREAEFATRQLAACLDADVCFRM